MTVCSIPSNHLCKCLWFS